MRGGKGDLGKVGGAKRQAMRTRTESGRTGGRVRIRAREGVTKGIGRIWVAKVHGNTIKSAYGNQHSEQNDECQDFSLDH